MYLLASFAGSCTTAPPVAQPVPTTIEGYKKIVEDQLGSLWYRQTRFYADGLSVGTVVTQFAISSEGGRIRQLKIVSNTANAIVKMTVLHAIRGLRVPPVPPAILKNLPDHLITFEYSFTVYPPNDEHPTNPARR
jgi:hypothetical protein